MSGGRRLLILYVDGEAAERVQALTQQLTSLGATVSVRHLDGDYDGALDEISAADTVICWR